MKRFIIGMLLAVFMFTGCNQIQHSSAEEAQQKATSQLMNEAQRAVGMPDIPNFRERRLMKMILELRDRTDLICYAYLFNKYAGKFIYLGKCVGYGLPYSTQYTNPEKIKKVWIARGWAAVAVPQADPNGLFSAGNTTATWLMLINPKTGKPQPIYEESELTVSPFPLPKRLIQ